MNRRYVLSVMVENHAGVLSHVAGLFSRRGFNISSLTVGETENSEISRITIMLYGDEYVLEQIQKQLTKLEDVISITELKKEESVFRELVLIKVAADDTTRAAVVEISNIFRAKVIDIAKDSITLEITGEQNKAQAFIELMEPYGVIELARTGLTALERGSSQYNKLKENEEN